MRSVGRALRSLQRQRNFADEPLIAPIKTQLTAELAANYFFHNARAEPARLCLFSGVAAPDLGCVVQDHIQQ
jgi:hypothetical protein